MLGFFCLFFILRTIVLFNLRADDLASDFSLQGIPVQSLHGNREQCDREQALDDFKTGMFVLKYCFD